MYEAETIMTNFKSVGSFFAPSWHFFSPFFTDSQNFLPLL